MQMMVASRKSNYPEAVARMWAEGAGMLQGAGLWAWVVAAQINIVKTLVKRLNNEDGTWTGHGAHYLSNMAKCVPIDNAQKKILFANLFS